MDANALYSEALWTGASLSALAVLAWIVAIVLLVALDGDLHGG